MVEVTERASPAELIAAARGGDSASLGHLLELFRNYLNLLARLHVDRRIQGKVDPGDLVQETFLEAHRDFSQFRGTTEAEFAAWLRRILATNLANLVRSFYGTQRRDLNLERELTDALNGSSRALDCGLVAVQSSPSQQAARREMAVILADALRRLPDNYREVIVLRHLEGLKFPEVAQRLGRSEDGVKKTWARAVARLRTMLGDSA